MVFAHDTEAALRTAAALVNTAPDREGTRGDTLATPADLDAFVAEQRFTGHRDHDEAELAAVRELRPVLRGIWEADEEGTVAAVNQLLAAGRALPQLVRHDDWDWHLHATEAGAPLATRIAVEAAMALVDVVRTGELARLHVCAAEDCDDVVVDLSRNRSRRFCEGGCANRAHAAAYRARRAQRATPP